MVLKPRDHNEDVTFAVEAFVIDTQSRLHQLMKAKNVSKAELARRMGTSKARVSALFGDHANLTLNTVGRILAALDETAHLSSPEIDRRLKQVKGEGGGTIVFDRPIPLRGQYVIPPSRSQWQVSAANMNEPTGALRGSPRVA